ncbi:helix-hairpin-helix domain-containing protein [Rossellomorea aquimaris]|uniref:helix-hairpin-helix domain-containing protein n=1 Tax=Rossellomorea aquimaris TaxID=189382 RepID=UPI001CD645E1|nr:helix-hairpin-helix domain-containing protein [Rossellomorea aquimaris]MCA1057045.1 helix-hairpin-helix domain-containing protein [Rossellomorea aquimaris]
MTRKSPKLPLTDEERKSLRKAKIKLGDVNQLSPEELSERVGIPFERSRYLVGMSVFQQIPSIGPNMAHNVVEDLQFYSFDAIKEEKGEDLIIKLEKVYGVWMDPCVEDSLRCVVHHAKHPDSEKNWWDFTPERKAYRNKHGYPSDRPTTAWDSLDR